MARKGDERLDVLKQEIYEMRTEFQKFSKMEENLSLISKSIENMNRQIDKQQQQKVVLKYLDDIIREKSVTMMDS